MSLTHTSSIRSVVEKKSGVALMSDLHLNSRFLLLLLLVGMMKLKQNQSLKE